MTMQALRNPVAWPDFLSTNNLAWTNQTLDADGEYVACLWYTPVPVTIRGFSGRINSLVAGGVLVCTAETVANLLPTGTLIDANATVDVTISGTGYFNAVFPADVTIPAGVTMLVMRRKAGGTFNGALNTSGANSLLGPPRTVEFTGTEQHRRGAGGAMPFIGVPPSQTYVKLPWAWPVGVSSAITNIANLTEYGAKVSLPFKARCVGVTLHGYVVSTPSPAPEGRLYASDGTTLLASGAYDGRLNSGTVGAFFIRFSAPVTLDPGDYWIAWHSKGSGDVRFDRYSATGNGAHAGVSEVGALNSRADPGNAWGALDAWSPFTLVLDQLDDGLPATGPNPPTSIAYDESPRNVGTAQSFSPTVGGGAGTTFAVVGGSLPPGLSISAGTGVISGTPTTVGSYEAVVRVSNADGSAYGCFNIEIVAAATCNTGPNELDTDMSAAALELVNELGKEIQFDVYGTDTFDRVTGKRTKSGLVQYCRRVTPPREFDIRLIDGDAVRREDLGFSLPAKDLPFTPSVGMTMTIDGTRYTALSVGPRYSGQNVVLYRFHVRR